MRDLLNVKALRRLSQISVVRWCAFGAVVIALGLGVWLGLPLGLLALAGAALVGVVSLLWASVQSLTGETPLTVDEAIGLGAPSAEEERKRAVLRALKDLEYERAVGKISEEDFRELSGRYRQEAKTLLQALDQTLAPARARAEERLAQRLKDGPAPEKRTKKKRVKAPASSPERVPCLECEIPNEPDARFCKGCGAPLAGDVAS